MNNIVLVNQSGSKYLFSVPESIQLKEGDKVKCDTRRGITDGVCFTDSVTINASALPLVCKLTGATLPLKEIVGKVVTSVEMFNKPVEKPSQPISPQEVKPRFEVGQKVKVIGNCCCHGYSRGTILTLVRSVNFLRREPDWYVGEGTDYVSERDIEPYAGPEQPKSKYDGMSNKELVKKVCGSKLCTVDRKVPCPLYKVSEDDDCEIYLNANPDFRSTIIAYLESEDTPEPKKVEPKYWSGKVVCISTSFTTTPEPFTVGKVYEYKNGIVMSNCNIPNQSHPVVSEFDALHCPFVTFIPFKG